MTRARLSLGLLVFASVGSLIAAAFLGSSAIGAQRVLAALAGLGGGPDGVIVWDIRVPRAMAAYAVGFTLGVCGAALQGLLRNPLAEPGVLGISASASLGATFVIYYGLATSWALAIPVAAIATALAATGLIALAALYTRSVVNLILVGVGLSSFVAAIMALLLNLAPSPFSLFDMINWTLGSVANRSLNDLLAIGPFMATGLLILFAQRRGLSALTLGEEAAEALGLNLRTQRLAVVAGTGIATGAAVALAGVVGFVGIVAPHLVRPLVGHDPARSLLPAGLLAGVIVVLADVAVRLIPTTNELKLGVVSALLGAPVFVWIVARRRMVDSDA